MKKRATIVHLDGLAGVTPLVGGYLKAYALADPAVRADWEVELHSQHARVGASPVLRHLARRSPDLVAFSVYTWNAGLVRRLLPALRGLLPPTTRYLLGGVEVMNVARLWIDPAWEDVAVCDGEGERSFRQLLLELGERRPELQEVGGITFRRDGAWCSTPGQPRVRDLTELPSPWLSGALDDVPAREVALFETNRGCPFACEFCFWGGATGQKVYRQDLERIREELDWIARRGYRALSLCDANFGILPRDVEIARHLAAASRAHGAPRRIVFNSSKVHPERVEEISRVLGEAGLLTRHVFSLQSMDPSVLRVARRTGLERGPYREIQRRLNERGAPSLVELIWPMPGETPDSFREGVDELLGLGAQGFLVYPLLWLNNTGYAERSAELGVTTLPEADPASGGRVVVETAEVSFEEYLRGLGFALALHLLHDCRGLFATLQVLNALGAARFREVLDAFARWMDSEASGPYAERWRAQLAAFEDLAGYAWRGAWANAALDDERGDFDRLLADFLAAHPRLGDGAHAELVGTAFEYDLLCRPSIFLQTSLEPGVEPRRLDVLDSAPRTRRVRSAFDLPGIVRRLRAGRDPGPLDPVHGGFELEIDHRGLALFRMPGRTEAEQLWISGHCVQEIARFEPRCSSRPLAPREVEGKTRAGGASGAPAPAGEGPRHG